MSFNGEKACAFDNFITFGGAMVMHHNCHIPKDFLLVAIKSYLVKGVHLLCLEVSHSLPFCTINETIRYVIMDVGFLRCPKTDQVLQYFLI